MAELSPSAPNRPAVVPAPTANVRVGLLLCAMSALPIAGVLLIAPNLRQLQAAFASTPRVEFLAPIALTAPSLLIALTASFAGLLADHFGRKRLLLIGLLCYAATGMAPLVLESLSEIIVSRALMGICEALIITVSTALIGDYFTGHTREKYLSLQVACATLGAVIFGGLGGFVGGAGWRAPFWLYSISLVALVPAALMLREPRGDAEGSRSTASTPIANKFPWGRLAGIGALTFVSAIGFYVAVVQNSFLLHRLGYNKPQTAGLVSVLMNAAVGCGTFAFARFAGQGSFRLLGVSFTLMAAGLLITGAAHSIAVLCLGTSLITFAAGIFLPTLLNWSMRGLSFAQRGRGTGIWQATFWFGQFLSPLIVVALSKSLGDLSSAVLALGALFAVIAAVWWIATRGQRGAVSGDHSTAHV
jgi:MFS family permease